MKTLIKIITLSFVVITSLIIPEKLTAQQVTVGFQVFYDDLSPYGTWISSPEYGYVWLPSAGADFTPYGSNGYWANTDAGWTWVSNYPWGWAPFHYGRWYNDPLYGNMWVPGNEWGPGWVCWRQSAGYYGWAPIGPGISLEMAYSNNYNVRNDEWRFVRNGDFGRTDMYNHYAERGMNVTIIKNTTIINNNTVENGRSVAYNAGPRRAEVEKRAGKTFAPIAIKENSRHGEVMGKGELQIYRPNVQKSNSSARKEAPAKVTERKDLKSPAQQKSNVPVQQKSQPVKHEPAQHKTTSAPAKQEPQQPQHKSEPIHQQSAQQKTPIQPAKQEPQQSQHKPEPIHQQPPRNNNQQHQQQPKPEQQREQPRQEQPHQEQPQPHLEGEGNHPPR